MKPRHLMLLALPLVLVIALPMLMVVATMPTYGEVNPTFNYVIEHYNAHALEETGATNVVTGIILDYRAYDTLIETTVLFTGTIGVLLALKSVPRRRGDLSGRRHNP